MNAELEKLLTDLEKSKFFGVVEIAYQNGVAGHASVKRNFKFLSTGPTTTNRENRGENAQNGKTIERR
jgi:hypothetical protein